MLPPPPNNQRATHPDSAFYKYARLHSELHKPKNKSKLQTERRNLIHSIILFFHL